MDIPSLLGLCLLAVINHVAENVKYSAESLPSYGNAYGRARIGHVRSPLQTVCGGHGNTSCRVISYMLSHLNGESSLPNGNGQRIIYCRQSAFVEANVDYRAHYLRYFSNVSQCNYHPFNQVPLPATISVIS